MSTPSAMPPGRVRLYLSEVARRLKITASEVAVMIETRELAAVDVAKTKAIEPGEGVSRSSRANWRVPVAALESYLAAQ